MSELILNQVREIFTVSQLNATAREVLEDNLSNIYIEGEISNLHIHSSGHMYFTLKDEGAQVRCAFFRGHNRLLNFKPDNGMFVLMRTQVSLYEARGDFQLIIQTMEAAGEGALRQAYEQLKNKLDKQGLFTLEHKRPLPIMPKCIGIITSPTGAAIKDVLTVLERRFPALPIIIYPTIVQGETAAKQIVQTIKTANRRQECDVIILTRGGGSLEDLWCFNDENLAHTIFNSKIPIVAGVGHEVDFTIADFVADHRAPTPSAAAELISPDQKQWLENFCHYERRLQQLIDQILKGLQQQLLSLQKQLRHPGQVIREQIQTLDYLSANLIRAIKKSLSEKQERLQSLIRNLNLINPLNTLERGYAIVKNQQTNIIINDSSNVNINDRIIAQLAKGNLACLVEKINL